MNIAILTATYNRKEALNRLFDSLLNQTNKNFVWIVVDDGSTDNTEGFVSELDLSLAGFEVRYYKKQNGGKSRAVNYGLNKCGLFDFVLIVDDDEELYADAVDKIELYVSKYLDSNCVGMEFLRNDKSHNPIANYKPESDLTMSVQERKRRGLEIDGYTGYFVKKLGCNRFPEFDGEKYVGPGVLQMISSKEYDLLWPCVALGETEYLQGGITSQGRRLRLRNPKGMITYCELLQREDSGLKIRLKYSIMGYAYSSYVDSIERKSILKECNFIKICFLFGKLLGMIWKLKYSAPNN